MLILLVVSIVICCILWRCKKDNPRPIHDQPVHNDPLPHNIDGDQDTRSIHE